MQLNTKNTMLKDDRIPERFPQQHKQTCRIVFHKVTLLKE